MTVGAHKSEGAHGFFVVIFLIHFLAVGIDSQIRTQLRVEFDWHAHLLGSNPAWHKGLLVP